MILYFIINGVFTLFIIILLYYAFTLKNSNKIITAFLMYFILGFAYSYFKYNFFEMSNILFYLYAIKISTICIFFYAMQFMRHSLGYGIYTMPFGMSLNALVMLVNNYQMPVDYSLLKTPEPSTEHAPLTSDTLMPFLSDIITVDNMSAFSVGDILIFVGCLIIIARIIVVKFSDKKIHNAQI